MVAYLSKSSIIRLKIVWVLCCVVCAAWFFNYNVLCAQDVQSPPNAFSSNYVTIDVVKNKPIDNSSTEYRTGPSSLQASFHHVHNDRWYLGVGVGFKDLIKRLDNDHLTLFVVTQESSYLFRISYPLYCSLGLQWIYFLPSQGQKIPPIRDRDFDREIGFALKTGLIYILSPKVLLHVSLNRWRGIHTERLFGIETAFGLSYDVGP